MPGLRLRFLCAAACGVASTVAVAWLGVVVPGPVETAQLELPRPPREYRERRGAAADPWFPETRTEEYRTRSAWGCRQFELATGSAFGFRGRDITRIFERTKDARDQHPTLAAPEHGRWFFQAPPQDEAHYTHWGMIEAGFPYPALRALTWKLEDGTEGSRGAIEWKRPAGIQHAEERVYLPCTPDWVGFAANTGVWMAGWSVVVFFGRIRSHLRAFPDEAGVQLDGERPDPGMLGQRSGVS
ncbi:MAG: hypothetical protein AMXMBFR58_21180 [Phycisphaerae bacterium]